MIDGKLIASELLAALKPRLAALPGRRFFGAAIVGEDPASLNFLKQKRRTAEELGVEFRFYRLSQELSADDLRREVGRLAVPKTCGGFTVQLPIPGHERSTQYILNTIPPEKDVDLLSERALGGFYTGRFPVLPPSVAVVEEILRVRGLDLRRMSVTVIGAGFLIGRPVGFRLQNRVGSLRVFDDTVTDLRERLADADIVISGAGVAGLFGARDLKPGALVIDFGYGRGIDGALAGDFDPEGAEERGIEYTPTPGGTGPLLVVKLFENFATLRETRRG